MSHPTVPSPAEVKRLAVSLRGDDRRVITLPFMTSAADRVRSLFRRLEDLDEPAVERALELTCRAYAARHEEMDRIFDENFAAGAATVRWEGRWSEARRRLAGAYLTMEYSVEAAALFNPSVVAHPDQGGMADGALRFLLSLRATGEGHVSSIVFRTGVIHAGGALELDPPPQFISRARIGPDRSYHKPLFRRKLGEMGVHGPTADALLGPLADRFTFAQLHEAVERVSRQFNGQANTSAAVANALFLARSNYHVVKPDGDDIAELVLYPLSEDESRGMEDLRLVRFTHDDGRREYFGTYTAYNGYRILPMLLQTTDFNRIEMHSLNGSCAVNKGMALFPRKIGGSYVMCSRIDGQNLFISTSDHVYFWENAQKLKAPRSAWELMQIGNCGSPIETPEGWLLLTHGVGPLRTYCIGAILLDLDDPLKVIGTLPEPLITPDGDDREGYVPNVVYTCGALVHGSKLYLPFAYADDNTTFATVELDWLISRMLENRG